MAAPEEEEWKDGFELITKNRFVDAETTGHGRPEPCGCAARGKFCDDDTCLNFSTQTECVASQCGPKCRNQRFQKRQWGNLEIRKTPGKGHGLFTKDDIDEGEFVAEYCGDIICEKTMNERFAKQRNHSHLFMQTISPGVYLDGQWAGSLSRFINHCCEPNAVHDRWVVDGKMCIGVFTTRKVKAGEELSFDYRWEYNLRRPTKCRCGVETCRGFIEILTEEQKRHYEMRHGQWKKAREAEEEAKTAGQPLKKWLIDKRIKVYWPGNSKYLECDVETYNDEEKVFMCYYASDGATEKERLLDSMDGPEAWQWLDESLEEVTITRKQKQDDMEIVDQEKDSRDRGQQKTTPNKPALPSHFVSKIRVSMDVSLATAQYVLNSSGDKKTEYKPRAVWDAFAKQLSSAFEGIRVILPVDIDPPSLRVMLFGPDAAVHQAKASVEKSTASSAKQAGDRANRAAQELSRRQSAMLTQDWRLPLQATAPPAGGGMDTAQHEALERIRNACERKDVLSLSLACNTEDLTAIFAGSDDGSSSSSGTTPRKTFQGGEVSTSVERSLLDSVCKLGARIKAANLTTVYAMVLLIRFIRFGGQADALVRDSSGTIAACMMLAQKARGGFRPKKLRDLVAAAYCVVFKRTETDPEFSTDSIIHRVLATETTIMEALRYDVYVPDVLAPALSHWAFLNRNTGVEGEKGAHEETLTRTFYEALGPVKEVGHVTLLFAKHMPLLWQTWPVEAALIVSMLLELVCRYQSQPEGSPSKPPLLFLALWRTATYGLHLSLRQLMHLLQATCVALPSVPLEDVVSFLESLDKKAAIGNATASNEDEGGGEYTSERWSRLLQAVPRLVDEWIEKDLLRPVTLDEAGVKFPAQATFRQRLPAFLEKDSSTSSAEIALDFQERGDKQCGGTEALSRDAYRSSASTASFHSAKVQHVCEYLESDHQAAAGSAKKISSPSKLSPSLGSEEKSGDVSGVPCLIRSWPNLKDGQKETKRARACGVESAGVSPVSIRELVMMQQVHYLSPLLATDAEKNAHKESSSLSKGSGEDTTCPYLTIVLGVAKVTGDFALPQRVRKSSSGNGNGRLLSSSATNVTTEESDDESPRKQARLDDEYDESEILNMISAGAGDVEDHRGSSPLAVSSTQTLSRSFLVMPRLDVSLESLMPHIKHAAKLKAPWLSASFALALCHDVFAATHHMSSCGVVLKWQALDQIYVTPAGRIVFGGLSGASLVGEPAVDGAVGAGTTPLKSRDSAVADMGTEGSAEKKRKREKEGLPPAPPAPVPTPNLPFLHMSAPEIIFGGQASVASTVYTAGIVCAHILAGKSPVKTGENEKKQVQYLFRTLGTPKKEGYKNFQNLPLATTYGRHIVQEGKEPGESRSRVHKVLKEILPSHVLQELSGQASSSNEESDKGMVLDVLRKSTALVPHRRTSPQGLLSMPLFTKNAAKLGVNERKAGMIGLRAKLK